MGYLWVAYGLHMGYLRTSKLSFSDSELSVFPVLMSCQRCCVLSFFELIFYHFYVLYAHFGLNLLVNLIKNVYILKY